MAVSKRRCCRCCCCRCCLVLLMVVLLVANRGTTTNAFRTTTVAPSGGVRGRISAAAAAVAKNDDAAESNASGGSRYICLLEEYENTRGPYFFALLDQLFEQTNHRRKHVAFLTTQTDLDELMNRRQSNDDTSNNDEDNDGAPQQHRLETLQSSLGLDSTPEIFVLDDWNPLAVEERFGSRLEETSTDEPDSGDEDPKDSGTLGAPTIVWLYGRHNAYSTMHGLRTSGLDRWIQERCASNRPNGDNCIFVGEGAGAACAGVTMEAARWKGYDPKGAPELQVYGLNLLGTSGAETATTTEGVVFASRNTTTGTSVGSSESRIEVCSEDEVFVWAQPPPAEDSEWVATKFVMAPNRKGTIEGYATVDPLPPLVFQTPEGVVCNGEPSVDPSRSMQAGTIGDSEWWEG